MSMSMHVSALRDMDGEFKRMLEVKKFCDTNKVSYPKEVTDYFGDEVGPLDSEESLRDDLYEIELDDKMKEWSDGPSGYRSGYEIDIADIPTEVKTLRFYASW